MPLRVEFPRPQMTMVIPEQRQPVVGVELLAQWIQSDSILLLVSGAPGAGKSAMLKELEGLADSSVEVETVDDFPRSGQSLSDISLLLQSATKQGEKKLAIATQIRANDPKAGITSYLLQNYSTYAPWVVILEPVPIHEIASLAETNPVVGNSVGIQTLLRLDRAGHNTRFLRTPAALTALAEAKTAKASISAVVDEFVMSRLMSTRIENLNPIEHSNLLSRLCFQHFLGMSDMTETPAVTELEGIPDRAVSLGWLEQRLNDPADATRPSANHSPDARTIAEQSPFLTLHLASSSFGEKPHIILPDTLSYEYFVARGFINAIRADEDFKLAKKSLADLSDGMVVIFIQARIMPEDFPRLAVACQRTDLEEHNRMLYLYLLEDWLTFATLLRGSPPEYERWLEGFVNNAPNVFCWKMAAFQLLALGKFELADYLAELRKETPEDRAFETELLSLRGAGDISRLLIERMNNRELRRCRGVTAVRMGRLGSLQCVVAIGEAIADRDNSQLEINLFLDQLAQLVVRHSA